MDSIKRNRRAGPRVRVRSPDSGSVVMSSGSTVEMSSVTSERSHEEPMRTPVDFGNLANEHKTFPQRDEVQGGSSSSESSEQMSVSHHQAPSKRHRTEEEGPKDGFRTLDDEKRDLLLKLKRLKEQKVQISRDYSMHSNIHDMRNEYEVIRKNMQVEGSIKFQRKVLIALTSGMEFLNNKYDPFNVELNGWSETIMESITDYDRIFERLHEKYKGSATMPPEFELMMAVAGSAFTFHLSNTFFKKSMGDAMKNPNAMKNIMAEIKKATAAPQAQPQMPTFPPQMPVPPPVYAPNVLPQKNVHMEPRPQHTGVQRTQNDTDSEISLSSVDKSEQSVASSCAKRVPIPSTPASGRGRGRGRGRAGGRGAGRAKPPVNEILL